MRRSLLLAVALLCCAAPAFAAVDAVDPVPAATLLLPYFEVDLLNPNGAQTSFEVANSGNAAVVAHVTLWTDRAVPTYAFDMVLESFALQEVDLRLLFVRGLMPQTQAGSFGACAALLPPARLDQATMIGLQNAHVGQASTLLGGNCGGTAVNDGKARGFITIDVANTCSLPTFYPGAVGYFGVATTQNVLWGDYTLTDRANDFATADVLVHIEASLADYAPGDYTFYGRLVNETAADAREPLPQWWWGRYDHTNDFTKTEALIWRDEWPRASFPCASPPTGLGVAGALVFDDRENANLDGFGARLPHAAQRVDLSDNFNFSVPFPAGGIFYDLGRTAPSFGGSAFGTRNQGYVSQVFRSAAYAGQMTAWPSKAPTAVVAARAASPQCADGADNDGDGLVDFPEDTQCRSPKGVERPQCSDLLDNEAAPDALIDYPNDPQCWGPLDDDETSTTECDDGIDNDGDGQIDYGYDSGCTSGFDTTEALGACSDGIDNDSDGATDYPADLGCLFPADPSEANAVCSDDIDNDLDGLKDFPADQGCSSATDTNETNPPCIDGVDNDSDNLTDFPNDPGCANANGTTEAPGCNNGVNDDADGLVDMADPGCASPSAISEAPACNNGFDDDSDGLTDLADPGCTSASDNNEDRPCSDGFDNDGDGRIDYPNDSGCANIGDYSEGPDCADTQDNDGDGLTDFPADPGCASATDLNELASTTTRMCSDGVDNDLDGLTDFPGDPGCTSAYDDSEWNP